MSASYNDGTVQYGSRVIVVKQSDGTTTFDTYVADTISIRRPTKLIKRTQQLGEPSGSVGVPDFVEGSMSLQLASSTTKSPTAGLLVIFDGTINAYLDTTSTSETFYIHSPEPLAENKDAEKKVNVSLIKKYN